MESRFHSDLEQLKMIILHMATLAEKALENYAWIDLDRQYRVGVFVEWRFFAVLKFGAEFERGELRLFS